MFNNIRAKDQHKKNEPATKRRKMQITKTNKKMF